MTKRRESELAKIVRKRLDTLALEFPHEVAALLHAEAKAMASVVDEFRAQDTKRMDELERHVFTNREGEHELHFDFTLPTLREAIDTKLKGP